MVRSVLIIGMMCGVGAFVVAAVLIGREYFAVRGAPTERAVVLSVKASGTIETCGREFTPTTPGQRTTYQSLSPRPALPSEFSLAHCPDSGDRPGDVVTVRRVGNTQNDIYLDPIESKGQWLGVAGLIGVGTLIVVSLMAGVREIVSVYLVGRRRRRRQQRDDDTVWLE